MINASHLLHGVYFLSALTSSTEAPTSAGPERVGCPALSNTLNHTSLQNVRKCFVLYVSNMKQADRLFFICFLSYKYTQCPLWIVKMFM